MPDDQQSTRLPGLAKCILGVSFVLAICVWLFVTDDHGKLLPYNPQPLPEAGAVTLQPRIHPLQRGGKATERQLRNGIDRAGAPHSATSPAGRPGRRRDVFDKSKSREVKEAAGDPNSMFDMSTP
eukprot:scaffold43905_cov28-Tisochrysis_lutea.AAC.2